MRASDHGVPPRTRDAVVSISVTQDTNLPMFEQSEYVVSQDLPENTPVGTSIIGVSASDQDVSACVLNTDS